MLISVIFGRHYKKVEIQIVIQLIVSHNRAYYNTDLTLTLT